MNKNDVVYRDQIIDTLKKNMPYAIFDDDGNYTTRGMRLLDVISAVPAAQAQHKKGKWIHDGRKFKGGNDWVHCSECGHLGIMASRSNFCPNCGAKMDGENNA